MYNEDEIEEPTPQERIIARRLFIVLSVFIVLAGALIAAEIVEHLILLG